MNATFEEFLDVLASFTQATVGQATRTDSTLVFDVSYAGASASLVAHSDAPPFVRNREGHKLYGAYTILDRGYGDWVKGDDGLECASYVLSWLLGRAAGGAIGVPTEINLGDLARGVSAMPPNLDGITEELSKRSALRRVSRDRLRSLDGSLTLQLDVRDFLLVGVAGSHGFEITAPSDGILCGAVLGFLDGSTEGSDG